MRKSVLILGASGMAGHTITRYLESLDKYTVVTTARNRKYIQNKVLKPDYIIDIGKDLKQLEEIVNLEKPEIVINCIGLLVKVSEENPDKAIYINSYFPHWLEKITKNTDIRVFHLSTDCIKDGKGWYSITKAMGEIVNSKDLTIRMSIIGDELKENGTGLFQWFMKQKGEITGYSKCYWNGITTLELAKAIDKLIETRFGGLYQLAPLPRISKYNLLKLIQKVWKKDDVIIKPNCKVKHDRTLINTKTPIPGYIAPSSYENMLIEMKQFIEGEIIVE